MRRTFVLPMALLLCVAAQTSLARDDSQGEARSYPAKYEAIHSRQLAGMAPGLKHWVVQEGRRRAESDPDVASIEEAVKARLAGQEYSAMDVNALVQLVLRESYLQTTEDLRAFAEEVKAANARKKAVREAARDTMSELAEQRQMRMQKAQDRRAKLFEILSGLMQKMSDTQASITANLK